MTKKIQIVLAVAAGLLLPLVTLADIVVNFNSGAAAPAGNAIIISGTVTNNGSYKQFIKASTSSDSLAIVGQVAPASQLGLSINQPATNGFLPSALNPGETYQGSLIQIDTLASTTLAGYWGSYSILGGLGTDSTSTLATQNYNFSVAIPPNAPLASSTLPTPTPIPTPTPTSMDGSGLQMPSGLGYQDPGTGTDSLSFGLYQAGPRLIKLNGTGTVYWVSESNLKLAMMSRAVFLSYKNKDSEVVTVEQPEFDYYQNAKFIWLNGKGGIYKIEGTTKRLISTQAWSEAGVDPGQIIYVNRTEFNSYKTGSKITDAAELNN